MNTIKIKNTINFGAYFLAFMLIEAFVNTRAVMVSDSSNVNYIYSIGLVFTALGYILYDYVANKSHINNTFLFSIVAIIVSALMLLVLSINQNTDVSVIFIGSESSFYNISMSIMYFYNCHYFNSDLHDKNFHFKDMIS